ncbi:pteridine reductase [Moraxella caviae]|uniref:3-oxoacyl-[acyl-carrier-protein] reductase FabG n=1 Tax=Moraxella caviae TaxID=34060 RepID=A0A1T0ACP0_9GAMM|nr:pteridine reductase [Moraxella caviae]OOR93438.1 pteridine reductase [Moraxella caviae]STZ14097.1 3-oxoacyl-[acyl-carrier-protein] reductase FabG [Moraxella caviae]VEW13363.1 3-oxoacyl-[acyl-carrier-protein] reductase FabG [Moraxella caviae]
MKTHTAKHAPIALITGGAKRIGKAICTALHSAGWHVIIHCHKSTQEAHALADTLNHARPNSASVICAALDVVNDTHALDEFCAQALAQFGGLDLLVHNASSFYASDLHADTAQTLLNHWDDLFLTNAKAPLLLSHTLKDALSANHGAIVSILDIHAKDKPFVGYPIYNMAKAAHLMMVQSLALEFAPAVRVNGVAPGVNIFPENSSELDAHTQKTLTDSVPLGGVGTPQDIANAVVFLASAPYITGQILAVDGGRSLTLKGG